MAENRLRVFIIQKGFGSGTRADPKYHCLEKYFTLHMPLVPEPTFPTDYEEGMTILNKEISEFKPDVVIGCSRGGKYVAGLVTGKTWTGPILMISAMSTREAVCPGIPILLAHGTKDGINIIDRVREDILNGTEGLVKLVEFDDEHSLHAILVDDKIKDLVMNVYALKDKVSECCSKVSPTANKPKNPSQMRSALFGQILSKTKK